VKIKNQSNGMEMNISLLLKVKDLKPVKYQLPPAYKGLLGKKVGDVAEITVPRGVEI
jgi:transcription elongation factor GreA